MHIEGKQYSIVIGELVQSDYPISNLCVPVCQELLEHLFLGFLPGLNVGMLFGVVDSREISERDLSVLVLVQLLIGKLDVLQSFGTEIALELMQTNTRRKRRNSS